MSQFNYIDNTLHAESLSVLDIANKMNTPFYLYSATEIETNYQAFSQGLSKVNAQICYAVKANSNQAILKTLALLGSGADVVSAGELKRVLAAGIPASKIVFSGVGKTAQEISAALKTGILQFNVESKPELKHISEICLTLNLTANIAIRINPDIEANTHEKISTGKAENKFGIEYTNAKEIYAFAASLSGINVQGIDVHIGSQITSLTPFKATFIKIAKLVTELTNEGHSIKVIDVGGGLGVTYNPETEKQCDLQQYAELIHQYLSPLGCSIIVEPGRALLASAGLLVTRVNYVKTSPDKQFLILDAAMNDFARPSLYDAYHQIIPVVQKNVKQQSSSTSIYDIVGPVCETGDTFAKARELPSIEQGELLVIKDTGAYGSVMSSTYNTRPFIGEMMVKGKQLSTIREPQTLAELINKDKLPNWL